MREIISNVLFNYEFVCVFLSCSIIFLLISILIKKQIVRKMSIVLFSVSLILFAFELSLSFFMLSPNIENFRFYINNIDGNTYVIKEIEYFDKNNKKHKRRLMEQEFNIKDYTDCNFIFNQNYSLYGNDFRVTKCNNNSEEVFLFLGCSFTFGDALDDFSTLPYNFSKLYNFEKNIINCGVQSVSTNSVLNIINNELFLPLINNKNSKIKHCFYSLIDDHIYRNFRYEGFCLDGYVYKDNKWYIPTAIGKMKCFFAKSYIFRKVFVPIIDEYFKKYYEDYMIKSLEEMNEIVEKKYNSKLTIIVWPEFDESFIDELKGTNLDLIFLPDYFNFEEEDYKIKYDGHPTAKANEEIAEILCNHINENKK